MIFYMRKIIVYFSLFVFIVISMVMLAIYLPSWLTTIFLAPHIIDKKETISPKEIFLKETISLTTDNSKNLAKSVTVK